MITVFVSHLSLLDTGLANILTRFLAAQKATSNAASGSRYLATTFYLLMAIGFLLLATSPVLIIWFMQTLQVDSSVMASARESTWVAIIFTAVSLPLRVGHGLLSSIHQIDKLNIIGSLSIAVRIILIMTVFQFFEPELVHLALIVFGSTLLGTLMVFISGIRSNGELSLKPSHFSLIEMRELLSLGGSALIVTLSALLMTQSGTMITGYILGPEFVPVVAYPLLIFTALTPFIAVFQTLLTPVASALSATHEKQRILLIFQMAVRYQSAAALFLLFVFVTFGETLIVNWLSGPNISEDTLTTIALSVMILLTGFAFSSVAFIGRAVLTSVGRHWPSAIIEFATALIALVFGYSLLRFSSLGVYGIAVGVTLALVVRGILFYPYLIGRYFGISPIKVVIDGLGLNLILAFTSFLFPILIYQFVARHQAGNFTLPITYIKIAALAIWCLIGWRFLVEMSHKTLLNNALSRAFSSVSRFIRKK